MTQIRVIGHDDQGSVVELLGRNLHLRLVVSNVVGVTPQTEHAVHLSGTTYRWTGNIDCQALTGGLASAGCGAPRRCSPPPFSPALSSHLVDHHLPEA